ncbi:hypothetical protein M3231_21300 [Neobacillus mesonae]|nr:hypothetical protein [Neobacillus mesonae]
MSNKHDDHSRITNQTSPEERSDQVNSDPSQFDQERPDHTASNSLNSNRIHSGSSPAFKHSKTDLFARNSFYFCMIVILLVILIAGVSGINLGVAIVVMMSYIEWLTKYILPWIFLYYFIKLARAYIKSKQG